MRSTIRSCERAEILLKKLRDDVDESVSLALAADVKATYLLVFEPSHSLRFLVKVGSEVRSLHATSAGKAVLGSLPPEKFDEYLKSAKLTPLTAKIDHDQDAAARRYRGGAPPWLVPQSRRKCRGRHHVVVLLRLERRDLHRDDCRSGGAR